MPLPGHSGTTLTISASANIPQAHTDEPSYGLRNLYLWVRCSAEGVASIQASTSGDLLVYAFTGVGGTLNTGTATNLLIAVPNCPMGSDVNRILGYWTVLDNGGWLCLMESPPHLTMNYSSCNAVLYTDPEVTGFASDGQGVPSYGANGCATIPEYYPYLSVYRWHRSGGNVVMAGAQARISHSGTTVLKPFAIWCGAWVGVGDCAQNVGDKFSARYFQVGYGQAFNDTQPTIFFEYVLNPGDPLVRGEFTHNEIPLPTNATYRLEKDPSGYYNAYLDNVALTGLWGRPSGAQFGSNELCVVNWGGEAHNSLDHIPGSYEEPVLFTHLKYREDPYDVFPWKDVINFPYGSEVNTAGDGNIIWDSGAEALSLWDSRSTSRSTLHFSAQLEE